MAVQPGHELPSRLRVAGAAAVVGCTGTAIAVEGWLGWAAVVAWSLLVAPGVVLAALTAAVPRDRPTPTS